MLKVTVLPFKEPFMPNASGLIKTLLMVFFCLKVTVTSTGFCETNEVHEIEFIAMRSKYFSSVLRLKF